MNIVEKYGGTSVADLDKIRAIAVAISISLFVVFPMALATRITL